MSSAGDGVERMVTALPADTSAPALPNEPLPTGATCTATVRAAAVADRDTSDPPDHPEADYAWHFEIMAAPLPLVAGFTHNGPVWIEATVVFTNTTTGPGAPSFLWDFGDGQGTTATPPPHAYAAPRTYTVTLQAPPGSANTLSTPPL